MVVTVKNNNFYSYNLSFINKGIVRLINRFIFKVKV